MRWKWEGLEGRAQLALVVEGARAEVWVVARSVA